MIYDFLIHFNNFSLYYACCVVTTFIVFISTIIINKKLQISMDPVKNKQKQHQDDDDDDDDIESDLEDDWSTNNNVHGLQARYKRAKLKSYIPPDLTNEQITQEKESELESLAAIYKLLKERKDIYPDATMNDLKHQLNLYKTDE